jgi:prepilin-type N-terminal cleavage/methylation domain-containing protein
MRPSQQRSGFTLIELLAVMAIMGAMLALSIAAFSKMGSGSSIRASSMMFKSSVSMACHYQANKNDHNLRQRRQPLTRLLRDYF